MATYLVTLPTNQPSQVLQDSNNSAIVIASTAAIARQMAAAAFGMDVNGPWADATVTDLVLTAGDDWGQPYVWDLTLRIFDPAGVALDDNATGVALVTNTTTADTADEIGALLVTAIEAAYPSIANAAYDSGSQVLTIASGAGGDDLGDHTVYVPSKPRLTESVVDSGVQVDGFFGAPTHEGAATDALAVTLAVDALVQPRLMARCKV